MPAIDYIDAQRREIERAYSDAQTWSTCAPTTVSSYQERYTYVSDIGGLAALATAPTYPGQEPLCFTDGEPRYQTLRQYPSERVMYELMKPKRKSWLRKFFEAWRAYEDWVAAETVKVRQ